jgi:hypothetical protein
LWIFFKNYLPRFHAIIRPLQVAKIFLANLLQEKPIKAADPAALVFKAGLLTKRETDMRLPFTTMID